MQKKRHKTPYVLFSILALEICRSVKVPTTSTNKKYTKSGDKIAGVTHAEYTKDTEITTAKQTKNIQIYNIYIYTLCPEKSNPLCTFL